MGSFMPVAAGLGEAVGSLGALVHCWHAPYQVPAGKAAIWPAWVGFEPFPVMGLQEEASLSLYPN